MNSFRKKIAFYILLFCISISLFAENDYYAEIGLNVGAAHYIGDANSTMFKNSVPSYGALFRFKQNKRIATRLEYNYTVLKGSKDQLSFTNIINALDLCEEFNFFDLEKNEFALKSRLFSPYIFAGVGAMLYNYETNRKISYSVPFGLGIKLRLNNRFNLNVQYSSRLLFADDLEGKAPFNNPQGLNGSNFMNNDLLSNITVGLTINFWERKCKCVMRMD